MRATPMGSKASKRATADPVIVTLQRPIFDPCVAASVHPLSNSLSH